MQPLNFSAYTFRFKNSENKRAIFDEIRKKFVVLTPEECVRQHVILFLISEMKYPKSWINVEKVIKINGLTKRYDVVVFNPNGTRTIDVNPYKIGAFTGEMIELLNRSKPGDVFYLDEVRVKGPDGQIRKLPSIAYTLI
jgi:hypothetical protein